jgi:hypothetical protein
MTKKVISHEEFAHLVNTSKGASRTFRDKTKVQGPGVMVSDAGAEEKSPAPLTAGQAQNYFEIHAPSADEKSAHGGWKEKKTVYQDKSRKYDTIEESRKAAEKNNQISGYDLGGTDISRPQGGYIYYDRRLPGIETDPNWKTGEHFTGEGERLSPKPNLADKTDLANINRGATRMTKSGKQVPVTINEVLGKISSNRRKRRKGTK